MEGESDYQGKVEMTKSSAVYPIEQYTEKELENQKQINKGTAKTLNVESICDICQTKLYDERNLYIHKVLKHGKSLCII